ncbi:MAG TPA: hypothetical protein PK995_08635 [Bacteroidia bacterium]|nr:hypothetical protein [Bacteroidia bacterium]
MRLDEKTRMAIKNSVLSLDSNAKVFLFGSRTDSIKFISNQVIPL